MCVSFLLKNCKDVFSCSSVTGGDVCEGGEVLHP